MRNYFAIAFTCVYLTLTVGVAKTTHYCMGREKSSSVFSFTTQKCICSVLAKKMKSCCDDQHEIIKIDDDQSGGPVLHLASPEFNLIGELYTVNSEVVSSRPEVSHVALELNLPPPKIPLYQSHCSLVFYDSFV